MSAVSRHGSSALRLDLWHALHHAGPPAAVAQALLQHFGDIETLFAASVTELGTQVAHADAWCERMHSAVGGAAWTAVEAWLALPRNHLVAISDPAYPSRLRETPGAPLLLYVHGHIAALGQPQLAIVGSRNPTPVGIENAHAFAAHLAGAGLAVTSGLALGIDAAAHRGALSARGITIAVAGTGLDRVYPARHRQLAHEIAEQGGALISEFALGSPPRREHFPQRNRVISGMSLGTLVVEAAVQSGSLITARIANEQGREVFAIPGSIHSPLARGCHMLIRQGAKLVETAQDILEELTPMLARPTETRMQTMEHAAAAEMPADSIKLLRAMGHDPVDIDTLAGRCGLTTQDVSSMLLLMELHGHIAACPGGRYMRTSTKGLR